MSDLKQISEDACLLDIDKQAWLSIVDNRGGCRCFLSPPCNACSDPISEEELNAEGYTMLQIDAALKGDEK